MFDAGAGRDNSLPGGAAHVTSDAMKGPAIIVILILLCRSPSKWSSRTAADWAQCKNKNRLQLSVISDHPFDEHHFFPLAPVRLLAGARHPARVGRPPTCRAAAAAAANAAQAARLGPPAGQQR